MPCNTIQRVQVDLGKIQIDILAAALNKMGFTANHTGNVIVFSGKETASGNYYSGSYRNGKLELVARGLEVNAIRRAYSAVVVERQAKKKGWILRSNGSNKYTAIKRA